MDTKELRTLYGRMVASCRMEPSEAELGAWKAVLSNFSESQLDAACRRWKADTEVEERTGKPRGNRLPSPAELKLSIELFERNSRPSYDAQWPTRQETERHQATPEWEEAYQNFRATLMRIAKKTAFPEKRA